MPIPSPAREAEQKENRKVFRHEECAAIAATKERTLLPKQ